MKGIQSLFLSGLLLTSPLYAAKSAHTWHKITAKNGHWLGRLVISSAEQGGFFTDENSTYKGQLFDFKLSTQRVFNYGFGFDITKTDFDIAYTLTLYQPQQFVSKACVFDITATSPANPDIRVQSYNSASCHYEVIHGVGENFSVA